MPRLISERTTRYTQMPWPVFPEILNNIKLNVVHDGHHYSQLDSFEAHMLRICNFEISFVDWDWSDLSAEIEYSGIEFMLAVTIEDTAIWESSTEFHLLSDINPTTKIVAKPKFKLAAFEGLAFRLRIIATQVKTGSSQRLRQYGIVAEREILLHTENSDTNFVIKVVDKLPGNHNPEAAYTVCYDSVYDPLEHPMADCVYIEILKEASDKHTIAHASGSGALVDSYFLTNVVIEIIFGLREHLINDSDEPIDGKGGPKSMVEQVCNVLGYGSAADLHHDLRYHPQLIFMKVRQMSKLLTAFASVRK